MNRPRRFTRRQLVVKIAGLVLVTALLGLGQGWAASRSYRPDRVANIHLGVLHGVLMPAALPALLMGKDVPIYAPSNEGRTYKLGYVLGINLCGTVFFGWAFWRPRAGRNPGPQ